MPLTAPNLDDRTYREIFAEAKARIPRYLKEWTNHNDSDPGIALLQLFAWMTELTLYRLNRVPERNYLKFLQLLGIELTPRQPATTELTFTLARNDLDHIIVPKGTQVAAAEPDEEGQNIVFETDEALIALGATLAAVQVFDGVGYSVRTNANAAIDQQFYPFGVYAREGSALLLGFDSPIAFTKQQINLAFIVHAAADAQSAACSLQLGQLPTPAILRWEYWAGSSWKPLSVDRDDTQAFALSGHVYWRGPGAALPKAVIGDVATPLYWVRCRLERSFYERAPQLAMVLTNTIAATQATTIRDAVLGGSNGRPNQRFFLANPPVVALPKPLTLPGVDGLPVTVEYLQLEVSERPEVGVDPGFQVWQAVDDFAASGPNDAHYTLNRTTGEIGFGDGNRGRIPVANPTNPNANVVVRLYRTGGGTRGNLGSNLLTNPLTFVDQLKSVTNLFPATGGSAEESVEAAKQRAASELKSRSRAVTVEDFEYFARETPGVQVKRAKALPLTHPQFTGAQIPGVVTVIVVPESDAAMPLPGPRTLAAVCACLNEHRLLTTEVYVTPPTYRQVAIEAEVIVQPQADLAAVKLAVEEALTTYFHPLRGGDSGQGWDFGQTIFFSKVYQTILGVSGVDRIANNQLVIYLDAVAQPFCRDVPIGEGQLLYSEQHDIRVSYSRQ